RVALDQLREDATHRLDTERERRDVEQQHVLHFALEHAGLDRSADRDDLVGVDALVRLLATAELADELLDHRHAGRAADQDDVIDLRKLDARVLDGKLERAAASIDEVGTHALELGTAQLL